MVMAWITRFYAACVSLVSIVALIYIYAFPPQSMLKTRDGVPHFTPQVVNPETGNPIDTPNLPRLSILA